MVQTAEGALNEVHDMLNRMVELATKAANGVYTDSQRGNYKDEVTQLMDEIDRIAASTNFNSLPLLDGTMGKSEAFTIATGAKAAEGPEITLAAPTQVHLNKTGTTKFQEAKVEIDLSTMKVTGTSANGGVTDITVTYAGKNITIAATVGAGGEIDIADFAVRSASSVQNIGGADFDVAISNGILTLTMKDSAADLTNDADALAINNALTGDVTLAAAGANAANTEIKGDALTANPAGYQTYHAPKVTLAAPEGENIGAGATFDLAGKVKDGASITIDGKTFTLSMAVRNIGFVIIRT